MLIVITVCLFLVVVTTVIHYEVLSALASKLPPLRVESRAKVLVVVLVVIAAHLVEIALYALGFYALVQFADVGTLGEPGRFSFANAVYFSSETYTSVGYGDVVPVGHLRLMAGIEALNGLVLIGWSASYTFIAMQQFWGGEAK
ncbi:MAG: two pore domain potassium channel family protein [Betaproteobacteria bacterium]|nr:two pore domain potassium channel family protein [Betaproteobacteria bacterium]MBV9361898.1 two pore domain potassium channel family protein [Betaproteobacteria bacterium]